MNKRNGYPLTWIAVAGLASSLIHAAPSGLNELKAEVKKAGFTPVYPLIDGLSAGMLLEEEKDSSGIKFQTVVCEDLFSGQPAQQQNAVLASKVRSATSGSDTALNLFPALFRLPLQAGATFKTSGVENVEARLSEAKIFSIAPKVDAGGATRIVSKKCLDGLSGYFDKDGKPTRKLLLVKRTLSVGALTYKLNVVKGKEAGLKAELEKTTSLGFSYKKNSDTDVELTFSSTQEMPRAVAGYNMVAITKLKKLSEVSSTSRASISVDDGPNESDIQLNIKSAN